MSDERRIRIRDTEGATQRLVVPADAIVEILQKSDQITTYYSGQAHAQAVTVFMLQVRRGDAILAQLPGVIGFREESIRVESGVVVNGEIQWSPAE